MTDSPPDSQRLAELELRCKQLGLPLTVQRRAILAALVSRSDHPTADDLYDDVIRRLPGVSRGTVYRALDTLVELGLAMRVGHPGSAGRFDAKTHRHHHRICDRCGEMADLEEPALNDLPVPDLSSVGFRVKDYSVHIRGLCGRCAAAEQGAK